MSKKPAEPLPDKDLQPDPPTHEHDITAWAASARNAAKNTPDGFAVALVCVRCDPDGRVVGTTSDPVEAAEVVRNHAEEFVGVGSPHRVIPKPVEEDSR